MSATKFEAVKEIINKLTVVTIGTTKYLAQVSEVDGTVQVSNAMEYNQSRDFRTNLLGWAANHSNNTLDELNFTLGSTSMVTKKLSRKDVLDKNHVLLDVEFVYETEDGNNFAKAIKSL